MRSNIDLMDYKGYWKIRSMVISTLENKIIYVYLGKQKYSDQQRHGKPLFFFFYVGRAQRSMLYTYDPRNEDLVIKG